MSGAEKSIGQRTRYEAGAAVSTTDLEGITPLHLAAMEGHADVVDELLGRGADANARELQRGETALHFAALSGHKPGAEAIVESLLRGGADAQAQNTDGRTPTDLALQRRNTVIAAAIDEDVIEDEEQPDRQNGGNGSAAIAPPAAGSAPPLRAPELQTKRP